MRKVSKWTWLMAAPLLILMAAPLFVVSAGAQEGIMVGRVALVEGEVLRYVPDSNDWVLIVKDIPFGFDDALYSGEDGKAEMVMPNNTRVRIGTNTQIQMITLKKDLTEVDQAVGTGRFYNASTDAVLKVTTPFGYVVADPSSSFDLYVGDQSVEVISLGGYVDFVKGQDEARYDVTPGAESLLADASTVTSGDGTVDADWDDWNAQRETFWQKKLAVKGDSIKYLPPALDDSAADLDEQGTWDNCSAGGVTKPCWAPKQPDYEPYVDGQFVDYQGDQLWVSNESTGYCTHHYGRWFVEPKCGCYRWLPPEPVAVAPPPPEMGEEPPPADYGCGGACFAPNQVIFGVSAGFVGWCVPPLEIPIISCCHRWGRDTVIMDNSVQVTQVINQQTTIIQSEHFQHHGHVVDSTDFHGGNHIGQNSGYSKDKTKPTTIVDKWGAGTPTDVHNKGNHGKSNKLTNKDPSGTPDKTAIDHINKNKNTQSTQGTKDKSSKSVGENLTKVKNGQITKTAKVDPPKSTPKIDKTAKTGVTGQTTGQKGTSTAKNVKSTNVKQPTTTGKGQLQTGKTQAGTAGQMQTGKGQLGTAGQIQTGKGQLGGAQTTPKGPVESGRLGGPRGTMGPTGADGKIVKPPQTGGEQQRGSGQPGGLTGPRTPQTGGAKEPISPRQPTGAAGQEKLQGGKTGATGQTGGVTGPRTPQAGKEQLGPSTGGVKQPISPRQPAGTAGQEKLQGGKTGSTGQTGGVTGPRTPQSGKEQLNRSGGPNTPRPNVPSTPGGTSTPSGPKTPPTGTTQQGTRGQQQQQQKLQQQQQPQQQQQQQKLQQQQQQKQQQQQQQQQKVEQQKQQQQQKLQQQQQQKSQQQQQQQQKLQQQKQQQQQQQQKLQQQKSQQQQQQQQKLQQQKQQQQQQQQKLQQQKQQQQQQQQKLQQQKQQQQQQQQQKLQQQKLQQQKQQQQQQQQQKLQLQKQQQQQQQQKKKPQP